MSRLLFISTKNRWFYRVTMLACCLTFVSIILGIDMPEGEWLHRYLAYLVAGLIGGLTLCAPFYKKQFSLSPFLIGLILLPLSLLQIRLCFLSTASQSQPFIILAHFLVGIATLSFLWWMGRITSPDLPANTHSSTHKWRPWAWLALIFLLTQIVLGSWINANYSVPCKDFPFCNGQLLPRMDAATLSALLDPLQQLDPDKLTDIQLLHHLGIATTALYLGLFSILLLFNRYLYQIAFFMIFLLGAQVALNVINLGWPHPDATVISYNAVSLLLLLAVITLLINLYRKSQDYWYG